MSKISRADVAHVAFLSRLSFSPEELDRFTRDLDNILTYMEKLNELDTDAVEPTSHPLALRNVFRPDEVEPSLDVEDALSNAPEREAGCFEVPKIIQED